MSDSGWCPRCGSEFQPAITTCPDCGVSLTTEPPAPDPPSATELEGHEPVAYELQDWPQADRDSLEWMLAGVEIAFEWDPPGVLMVPERRADEVEGFIEYIEARGDDATATDGDVGQGSEASAPEPAVDDALPNTVGDGATATEDTVALSGADLVAPLTWLEPQLDQLRRAYLRYRADRDAESAFERALATTLDEDSQARLASVFDGDEDEIYGPGFGERALRTMRDAFEQLAWTLPEPVPEATPDPPSNSPRPSTR
jgi:hypothetical protein